MTIRLGAGRALPLGPAPLLALAMLLGAGAGLAAVGFRELIELLTRVFTGYSDYAGRGSAPHADLPGLGRWFVLATPVLAGLLYGPLVYFFAREARGHGVPEVMLAVARHGGRIRPQVAVVKALASALCIGGGGSVGREGPIVQIGAALGSSLAGFARLDERRVRLLVACGAAAGISATFNAPLAGVFFGLEVILRQFATESFGVVVLSSVTASVVARALIGDEPFLVLPAFTVEHVVQYPLFALLGVIAGLIGVGFSRGLYAIEDVCDAVWRGPEWLRPAAGGLLLGALLLVLPQMYGVGYPVLGAAVGGRYGLALLLVLLVGKVVACGLTIGIGGSGGVFAPSLFIGAMAGAAFGGIATDLAPGSAGSVGAYALVGMGAVFAGAARAPIAAVLILFELTGEYTIILPLMLAIVLATGTSSLVSRDTIYTRKLLRRGIDIDAPGDGRLAGRRVDALMSPPPSPVRSTDDLRAVGRRFALGGDLALPVLDDEGRYLGVLAAHAVLDALAADEDTDVIALTAGGDAVGPDSLVDEVLRRLDRGENAVPVSGPDGTLVGWVRERDLLTALAAPRWTAPIPRPCASNGRRPARGRRRRGDRTAQRPPPRPRPSAQRRSDGAAPARLTTRC